MARHKSSKQSRKQRLQLNIHGQVQGVGFRPFVYQLATAMQLAGCVRNTRSGVQIEVEGTNDQIKQFVRRLHTEKPHSATIEQIEQRPCEPLCEPLNDHSFVIQTSQLEAGSAAVPIDLSTCPDCLRELFDPSDRRYRYPFISCAHCGPRYSMITAMPYDRARTTMAKFPLCSRCQAEYENPADRRFHTQSIACPDCGPQLALWDSQGKTIAVQEDALNTAIAALRQGKVVAVKGIGGFQLWVDARSAAAVEPLRQRKNRPDKPFALMYPNLEAIQRDCIVTQASATLLQSPAAPIVLLKRQLDSTNIAHNVAPHHPTYGVMLPYAPLHHLLLSELQFPVIATSANRSGEPICIDEYAVVEQLNEIADYFLIHDRPIAHPIDDAVVKLVLHQIMVLRRGRGYSTTHIIDTESALSVLATGAHLKNTIALTDRSYIHLSPHIGDLDRAKTLDTFEQTIQTFQQIHQQSPTIIACDQHPDYLSTQYAENQAKPVIAIQHHQAHIAATMQEHHLTGEVLGIAWDGSGYGCDGTIWGGEFFRVQQSSFERVGHLRPFPLLGGDAVAREPCRVAVALLSELWGDRLWSQDLPAINAFPTKQRPLLQQMLRQGHQTIPTSSMGRLFDAVASLLDLHQRLSFEGQGAMAVEFAIAELETNEYYPMVITLRSGVHIIDWQPIIQGILNDLHQQKAKALIAAKFHNSLIEIICAMSQELGIKRIVLSGGCFQNQYLLERVVPRLQANGFTVYWPQQIPPNDGGIAFGQATIALQRATALSTP